MSTPLILDAADPAFAANPHATYDLLRSTGPVQRVRLANGSTGWLVTSYDEAHAALAHPDLSNQPRPESTATGARAVLERHMLATDAPDHTRLRHLVGRAFSARRIASLTPFVHEVTDQLTTELLASRGRVDFVSAFAFPLPVAVVFEVLGVPVVDRDPLRGWSYTVGSPVAAGSRETVAGAWSNLLGYFTDLVAAKRKCPTDDLFSDLASATDDQGSLTEQELLAMAFLLLFAGYETTMNLLGSMALSLTTVPGLRDSLRARPELVDTAVEELLRHASPLEGAFWRRATADIKLGDACIPNGETVLVVLAAANRDPKRFPDPTVVDPRRSDATHLSFGYGAHYCVGAHLARLEARVALTAMVQRLPDLALDCEPADVQWRPGLLVRGPAELPVTVHRNLSL